MAKNLKGECRWGLLVALASAALSVTAALTLRRWRKQCEVLHYRLQELESSLCTALQQRSAERKGRIRAQQALRKALTNKSCADANFNSYPMMPVAVIQSCFSTRNGTPRQPLLVPHARACLILDYAGIPPAALEGLAQYSHCWILYVFHKNTDLPRLWERPAHQNFRAKVRVPRLQGGKMGVFATRSPHRPCPIGLTVAKVEAVHGRMVLLSGVDLVDGTPVLDIKPYLPYCDVVAGAMVPDWVKAEGIDDPLAVASVIFSHDFSASLASCWEIKVFDLSIVKPSDFFQHGLRCLEKLASFEDHCAQETRDRIRIMVAGGDGTVGWILGSIAELHLENRKPIPPVGIIPLGTGNDLARSFGWGGSFPFAWRSAVKRSLWKAVSGQICHLDSWQVVVTTMAGQEIKLPYAFRPQQQIPVPQDGIPEGTLSENSASFEGVFYNYYSIGMDAEVAYGFHHLRDEKPYLARGPIANKMIYSGYTCSQGWFCTPCSSNPRARGLNNILRLHIKKRNCSDWEQIRIPSSVRAVVALNLHNYASGRNPWGHPSPNYLEKKGFVEANVDDGLLEIFGLKEGWHTSFVMVDLITAKHLAQASALKMELRSGRRKRAYMQMDGEPWKQPLSNDYSTMIEITRVPYQSLMISGV